MAVIGSEKKPTVLKTKKRIKLNSSMYGGDARQNYNDNYDRIFNNTKKTKEAK
jgi:hypothetical protein